MNLSNKPDKIEELGPRFRLSDITTAASLLTRIPVRDSWVDPSRLASSVWAFPIIGVLIGFLSGLLLESLIIIGISNGVSAAFAIGLSIFLTGGLHEDGIADCADGLGGGTSKERALEIMKDSRIGAYGAIILMLFLITRWSAVADLANSSPIQNLVIIGAVSRLPMVLAMVSMENARDNGLSHHVGKPHATYAAMAFVFCAVLSMALLSWLGLVVLLVVFASALPLLILSNRKIGGQTGDVLGGTQQCSEVAALAFLTVYWI